jgi:hypothetical protein
MLLIARMKAMIVFFSVKHKKQQQWLIATTEHVRLHNNNQPFSSMWINHINNRNGVKCQQLY